MKSFCTFAALAVASAIAQGSFADAIGQGRATFQKLRSIANVTGLTELADAQHCTVEINKFRKEVDPNAKEYIANEEGEPDTDIASFLSTTCENLKSGDFTNIIGDDEDKAFVISATRSPEALRTAMTCEEAVQQWKEGYSVFSGEYPGVFKESGEPYTDPNAVAFVSLLSEKPEIIYCGTPTGCDEGSIVCYIKPSSITEGSHPITRQMWHKVEASKGLKPTLEAHGDGHKNCLEAVNAVRTVKGLGLPEFTGPVDTKNMKRRNAIGDATAYENALYNLKCEDIKDSKIHPNVGDEYTLIYAIKQGDKPPTAEEAVEFWKGGFTKLGTDVPPAFTLMKPTRTEGIDGTIYYDNAVAGFASLMVDDAREMRCYDATGCDNSALICFLSEPTLVENHEPISEDTWNKILALQNGEGDESDDKEAELAKRDEDDNCLEEINEFRTQEALGLKPFLAEKPAAEEGAKDSTESDSVDSVDFPTGLTCSALADDNAQILDSNSKRSLMYYYGSDASCSEAVKAWKKGYDKFRWG
ncbi:SAG family member [Eimeria mitis]|uniref:SAG family member n=1 Tax=Eimeria mitis TaxID=44415 RepID=U6JQQ7_9EIME|nr:SAG family member [Eimeria mitis]CDJ27784.1 SAG family member [Eimeria mitis]